MKKTLCDMQVGHHYRTSYTFWLSLNEDLNNDHPARLNMKFTDLPSFFVVERKLIPLRESRPIGRNVIGYRIQAPNFIGWIFLNDDDRNNLVRASNTYWIKEMTPDNVD